MKKMRSGGLPGTERLNSPKTKILFLFSLIVMLTFQVITPAKGATPGTTGSGDPVMQQTTRVITGTVVSDRGDPIPGVTVVVKGTTTGTVTDLDGKFNLVIPANAQTILFSFVGMKSQEFQATGKSTFDVRLEEDRLALDEVIVIGYGTARRQEYTGSVSSVKMENSPVALAPNTNALESLKGNVAGLSIGATNTAGGEPSMDIRGQNSISGSNDPLIILDGVIFPGSLNDINPNDIATFDVLKDAVSSAVYGSRSANGVIAITTKKGKIGKPMITFNASYGVQTWQNEPVMMTGADWVTSVNDRNKYTAGSTNWMKTGELANLAAGKETVWLDHVTRLGMIQDYQVTFSGGAENINYYLSASYNGNKGIVVGDDFTRLSLLTKLKTNITKWLELGVDGSYSKRDYSGFSASIAQAQMISPYGVFYRDEENKLLEKYPYTQSAIHPLWGVDDGTRDNLDVRNSYRLNSYVLLSIPWVKGLSYRLNYLVNQDKNQSGNFAYETYYVAEGEGLARYEPARLVGFLSQSNGNINNNRTDSYVFDNILNYKQLFGKHGVDATLVATRDYRRWEEVNTTGNDFAANGNTTLGMLGLSKATVQKVFISADERANVGYLGRLSYSFADRYFFSGAFRRDGASVFGSNMKWGNFASAGLAWRITQEKFMKNFEPLNNLKLKLSWGQNGNQGIGPYGTLSQVANGSSGGYRYQWSNAQGKVSYGLVQSTLGNSDLGWEKTESWNGGFESVWLKERIFVDFDAYVSKTTDQIFVRQIPVMSGFKTITTSMGQVNNRGFEVTVRTVNVKTKDLVWNSSVTWWMNRNKLIHLYGDDLDGDGKEDDDPGNSRFIGKSLGAIYGYKQDGIVQSEDTEYKTLTSAADGDPKYVSIDETAGIQSTDRQILGYNKENFRLSLSNTVTWKNIDLYVMLSGNFGGNDYYLRPNPNAYMSRTDRFNDNHEYIPYWTPENKSNEYPSAYYSNDGRFLGLQSRGFARIQDVSLSYTFDQPWVREAKISSFKLYISGKNLATFTNWQGGDPETGTQVRENTFPVPTTYTLGATLTF